MSKLELIVVTIPTKKRPIYYCATVRAPVVQAFVGTRASGGDAASCCVVCWSLSSRSDKVWTTDLILGRAEAFCAQHDEINCESPRENSASNCPNKRNDGLNNSDIVRNIV